MPANLTPNNHTFQPVPKQTGCRICGYARGHHPTARQLFAQRQADARAQGDAQAHPTPQSCGWTKAPIGCYWTRGPFGVHTVAVHYPQENRIVRYYEITRHSDRTVIGKAQTWADVERLTDRRNGTDRRQPR